MLEPRATLLSLKTADMEAMHAFYTLLLGPPHRQVSDAYFFALPGCTLVLWPGEQKGDGSLQICLRVDDLDEARAELPTGLEPSGIQTASHGRECFLHDPDSNTIILYQQDED